MSDEEIDDSFPFAGLNAYKKENKVEVFAFYECGMEDNLGRQIETIKLLRDGADKELARLKKMLN